MEPFKFTDQITKLFLRGGQVVGTWRTNWCNNQSYLIRMPKLSPALYDGEPFEYVWLNNYSSSDLLNIGGYRNGHLKSVKSDVDKIHREKDLYKQNQSCE